MKTFDPRRRGSSSGPKNRAFLDGQLLVAMPGMPDSRFARSVIYICAHSDEGAMGIVLNQKANKISFPELLVQLDVISEEQAIHLPSGAGGVPVVRGGPVETGRGFVLHTAEYAGDSSTLEIAKGVSLTATIDILRAIADGSGPSRALLALGYASWSAGQLESEIQGNGWLTAPAEPGLIFDDLHESKYNRALRAIGVDPAFLSAEAGHA